MKLKIAVMVCLLALVSVKAAEAGPVLTLDNMGRPSKITQLVANGLTYDVEIMWNILPRAIPWTANDLVYDSNQAESIHNGIVAMQTVINDYQQWDNTGLKIWLSSPFEQATSDPLALVGVGGDVHEVLSGAKTTWDHGLFFQTIVQGTLQNESTGFAKFTDVAAVPEPGTFVLLGALTLGIGFVQYRRSRV